MPETTDNLSDRQVTVLRHIGENDGCTAKDIAEAIEPGSDARGAAQTARRMPQYIARSADGHYSLTALGRKKVRELA